MVTKQPKSSNVKKLRTSSISIQINKSTWEKHKPRQSRDFYIRDTKLEGYYIRIRPNGKKTYNCYARLGGVGRKVFLTIGDCNLLTQDEARETARLYLYDLKQGVHPKLKIRTESAKNKTLEDLAEDYIKVNKKLAEGTIKDYRNRIKNCMPVLWKRPVTEITTEDIVDWWSKCNGNRNNQIAFTYARKLMSQATAKRYVAENPFIDAKELIGDFPEYVRKVTHVSQRDLWKFFEALRIVGSTLSPSMRDLIVFLIVTGKRSEESRTLTWKNVNFRDGTITLEKTKSGKVDVIPMTDFMYVMLKYRESMSHEDRPALNKHPIYVFHNRLGTGCVKDVRKSMAKINAEANLGFDLTPHDFRRTFATALAELNITNTDVAVLLNHAKRDVTEGYITRSLEYKQRNLERLEKYYNDYGEETLRYISVHWYEGNSNLFEPAFVDETVRTRLDKDKEREYLLGKNEDNYDGYGNKINEEDS
jgi:integrase